tara:strand:+ start:5892 stop:7214 length:1323 start_codon:yes stop_codon:yes gene_type:complete
MSSIFEKLLGEEFRSDKTLIRHRNFSVKFKDIFKSADINLDKIRDGSVVALIGDYDGFTIKTFLKLIDKKAIIVPLTNDTKTLHNYYFNEACVDFVIDKKKIKKLKSKKKKILSDFKKKKQSGLILFSSGTTGRPKAILHSINELFKRYDGKKKSLVTMNFLLFDHIGGINTLFFTLFNSGQIIIPYKRDVSEVVKDVQKFEIELLPTTPTFLRMLLFDDKLDVKKLKSLKIITYGAELMDSGTLEKISSLLPWVSFRQTYGMSEIGILRIKSENNKSLWIKIGGEGVEKKIINKVLYLKTKNKMIGYLNSKSPFDKDGWYNTNDIVETRSDGYLKIVGRKSETISVGGLKILPSEIERVALKNKNIKYCKAYGKNNPITGQHVEIICETKSTNKNKEKIVSDLKNSFKKELLEGFVPLKIKFQKIEISYRYKKSINKVT